jgi:hypothetical protein
MPTVTIDSKATRAALANLAKQIPYAAATAVNDLAFQVQRAELAGIKSTFTNPRPFTQRSVLVDRANKATLSATVHVRPEVAKYLAPYETGGVHVLPGKGTIALDPVDAKVDQYGQLPKGTVKRLTAQSNVFVGPVTTKSGATLTGVWERLDITRTGNVRRKRRGRGRIYDATHGALKLLVLFGGALPVNKSLGFMKRGAAVVAANAPAAFERAIAKALATAR